MGPKRVVMFLIMTGFFLSAWHYYQNGLLTPVMIEEYRDRHPVGALIFFLFLYAVSVIAALPSLPLNLAAGYFWGGLPGGIYSAIGATSGGWISFLAARWLMGQPLASEFDNKWAAKVQDEFNRNGWKFVAFARINPIVPTGALNYFLGLTCLSNRGFILATSVFLLPPSIAIAYIGDTLQTFEAQQFEVNSIIRAILIISASITFLILAKFAHKIFRK